MSVDDQFDRLTDLLIRKDGDGGDTDPAWPCSTAKLLAAAIGYEHVLDES